ncbi:jg17478 [Pararge aegeria aegeria]|uniref:Jg17478 protein n=1 Tax=Pararge aegeria aegeria TaxID=348720 RepID=A0A8S4RNL1_9NEOP|nr:jg17478 [Pararge aegeria aegeria]
MSNSYFVLHLFCGCVNSKLSKTHMDLLRTVHFAEDLIGTWQVKLAYGPNFVLEKGVGVPYHFTAFNWRSSYQPIISLLQGPLQDTRLHNVKAAVDHAGFTLH